MIVKRDHVQFVTAKLCVRFFFCTCSDLHYVVSRLVQNALCTSNCSRTEAMISHVPSAKINDSQPCFIPGGTNFGFMNGAKWGNYKEGRNSFLLMKVHFEIIFLSTVVLA